MRLFCFFFFFFFDVGFLKNNFIINEILHFCAFFLWFMRSFHHRHYYYYYYCCASWTRPPFIKILFLIGYWNYQNLILNVHMQRELFMDTEKGFDLIEISKKFKISSKIAPHNFLDPFSAVPKNRPRQVKLCIGLLNINHTWIFWYRRHNNFMKNSPKNILETPSKYLPFF